MAKNNENLKFGTLAWRPKGGAFAIPSLAALLLETLPPPFPNLAVIELSNISYTSSVASIRLLSSPTRV